MSSCLRTCYNLGAQAVTHNSKKNCFCWWSHSLFDGMDLDPWHNNKENITWSKKICATDDLGDLEFKEYFPARERVKKLQLELERTQASIEAERRNRLLAEARLQD